MSDREKQLEQDISKSLGNNIKEITAFFDMRKKLYTVFSTIREKQQILALYKDFLKQGARVQLMLNGFEAQDKKKYSTRIKNVLHGFHDKETLGTSGFNVLYMQGEIADTYSGDVQEKVIYDMLENGTINQFPLVEKFIDSHCVLHADNFLMRRFSEYVTWTNQGDSRSSQPFQKTTSSSRSLFMGIFPFKQWGKKEEPKEDPYGFLVEGDELMKQLIERLKSFILAKSGHTVSEPEEHGNQQEDKKTFEKVKNFFTEKILHRNKQTKEEIKNVFEQFGKEEMGGLENVIFEGELKNFFQHPDEKKIGEIIKTYSGLNTTKDTILKGLNYLTRKYKIGIASLLLLTTALIVAPALRKNGEDKIKALWYRLTPSEIESKERPGKLTSYTDKQEALHWLNEYGNYLDTVSESNVSPGEKDLMQKIIGKTKDKDIVSLEAMKEQWKESTDELFNHLKKIEGGYLYNQGFFQEEITTEDSLRLRNVIDAIDIKDIGKVLDHWTGKNTMKNSFDVLNLSQTIVSNIQFYPLHNESVTGLSVDPSLEDRRILINTKIALEEAQHTLLHEIGHKISKDSPYAIVTEGGNEYKVIKDSWKLLGKDYFGHSYTDAVIDYLLLSHAYDTKAFHDVSSVHGGRYAPSQGQNAFRIVQEQSWDHLLDQYQSQIVPTGDVKKIKEYEHMMKYRKLREIIDAHKENEIDPMLIMYSLDKDFPQELKNKKFPLSYDLELQNDSTPGFQAIFEHWGLVEEDFSPHGWQYLSGLWQEYQKSEFVEIDKLPLAEQMRKIDEISSRFIGRNIGSTSNLNLPSMPGSSAGGSGTFPHIFSKLWEKLRMKQVTTPSNNNDIYAHDFFPAYMVVIALLLWILLLQNSIVKAKVKESYKTADIEDFLYEAIRNDLQKATLRTRMIFLSSLFALNSLMLASATTTETDTIPTIIFFVTNMVFISHFIGSAGAYRNDYLRKRRFKKLYKKFAHTTITKNIALLNYNKQWLRQHQFQDAEDFLTRDPLRFDALTTANIPSEFNPSDLSLLPITKPVLKNIDEVFSRKATKQKKDKPNKRYRRLKEGVDSNLLIINAEDHQGQRINRFKTAGLAPGKLCIINETKKMELKNEVANNGQILVGLSLDFEYKFGNMTGKLKAVNAEFIHEFKKLYNFLAQLKVYSHVYNKNIDIMLFRDKKLIDIIPLHGGSLNAELDVKQKILFYYNLILENYAGLIMSTKADYMDSEIMKPFLKDKKYDKIIDFPFRDFAPTMCFHLDPENKRNIETMSLSWNDLDALISGQKIGKKDDGEEEK